MALFSRKPAPRTIATSAGIDAAGKALAAGDQTLAGQLCERAGADHQRVAMAILDASVDRTPKS